jgi:hypothetical protein
MGHPRVRIYESRGRAHHTGTDYFRLPSFEQLAPPGKRMLAVTFAFHRKRELDIYFLKAPRGFFDMRSESKGRESRVSTSGRVSPAFLSLGCIKGFLMELERKLRQRAPKRQNDIAECRLPAAQASTGEISVRILVDRVFVSIWRLLGLGKQG